MKIEMEEAYDSKHIFKFKLQFYKELLIYSSNFWIFWVWFVTTLVTTTVFAQNTEVVKRSIMLEAVYVRSVGYQFILVTLKNFWTGINLIWLIWKNMRENSTHFCWNVMMWIKPLWKPFQENTVIRFVIGIVVKKPLCSYMNRLGIRLKLKK